MNRGLVMRSGGKEDEGRGTNMNIKESVQSVTDVIQCIYEGNVE